MALSFSLFSLPTLHFCWPFRSLFALQGAVGARASECVDATSLLTLFQPCGVYVMAGDARPPASPRPSLRSCSFAHPSSSVTSRILPCFLSFAKRLFSSPSISRSRASSWHVKFKFHSPRDGGVAAALCSCCCRASRRNSSVGGGEFGGGGGEANYAARSKLLSPLAKQDNVGVTGTQVGSALLIFGAMAALAWCRCYLSVCLCVCLFLLSLPLSPLATCLRAFNPALASVYMCLF